MSAWIVGLVLAAGGPKPDDSAAKITNYFASHEHEAMLAHFLIDGLAGLAIIGIAVALHRGDTVKIAMLAVMIGAASVLARRSGAFPRWFATAGIVFAPLLAISGLAFPLDSNALYASLEVT